MRNLTRLGMLALAGLAVLALPGWAADNGAREGSQLGGPPPIAEAAVPEGVLLAEGFDDITNLPGWVQDNQSNPLGISDWFQGNDLVFPAQAGAPTSYIGANFNNTSGVGTISNWLLTPELPFPIGELRFWTRTATGSIWPDRLEVRASVNGASTNVGASEFDVGDFTTVLAEVNPTLAGGGYPEVWTEYVVGPVPLSGTGRIAFRYFVTNGGPSGANSNYIGIDTVSYEQGIVDTTSTLEIPTLGAVGLALLVVILALAALVAMRRRRTA